MIAGTLELQLAADVARLASDMRKAEGVVKQHAVAMQRALDDVRNTLTGLFGGISATAFGAWVKGAIDFQDELNDLNKTTDLSVSKLAGLALMSKQSGSDLTGVAQGINKLAMEMGKDAEKFAKIGITAKDPLEAFKQAADVIRAIEDPQLRAAVASEAFGKSWASLMPALSEGSERIAEMVKRGEALAGITTLDAQMADEFNDSLSELQTALTGTASNIAGDLMHLLTDLVKSLTDVTHEANQADGGFNAITETLRALIVFGGNVAYVISTIGKEIGVMAAQAHLFLTGDFKAAAQVGREWTEDAKKRREEFDAWEARMMNSGRAQAPASGSEEDRELRRMREAARLNQQSLRDFAAGGKSGGKDAAAAAKRAREQKEKEAAAAARKELEEQTKRDLAALEEDLRIRTEIDKINNDRELKRAEQINGARQMIESIEFETRALGLSNVEREKEIALRDLQRLGMNKESEDYRRLSGEITAAVDAREAQRESKDLADQTRSDFRSALTRAFEDSKNPAKAFVEAFAGTMYTRLTSRLADALTDGLFGKNGKGGLFGGQGFSAFDFAKVFGFGGVGGGVVPPNPFAAPVMDAGSISIPTNLAHGGAIVGADLRMQRGVSGGIFNGAPRFHTGGIVGDEVPIIAKRGEGVFTPAQMRALGGGGGNITIAPTYVVGDNVKRQELQASERRTLAMVQMAKQRQEKYGR